MPRRKICVVTGTRAEYGLLFWLMKAIQDDAELELQIIVTGMRLSPEFGLTYKVVEEDGFQISAKVEMLLSSDTPVGTAKSLGLGVIGFADALERLKPDILVLLGARDEILAAAQAALVARIPIAHISGGEITEGAIDEAIRHAITKMSHLHFVAAEPYRRRVIQLGEDPDRVFNVGDPGVANITKFSLLERTDLEKSLNFRFGNTNFLVTYHPETLGRTQPHNAMQELLCALDRFTEAKIIITKSNSDTGGRALNSLIDTYAGKQPGRIHVATSLGQVRYLSVMRQCDVVIGNSSSGIVEAPVMKKATVNIGDRQRGRLMAGSIINCHATCKDIIKAIDKALSLEFKKTLRDVKSLYGDGNVFLKIMQCIKSSDLDAIVVKMFHDLDY